MKKRIWELDALRGLCVLGMVIVHLVYDLVVLYKIIQWDTPPAFDFIQKWGGILFLLISGICVTLGRHNIRRGLLVLLCGFVCTGATYFMYRTGMSGKGIIIYFGVLHCLGLCMILWSLFRKLPAWVLLLLGVGLAALGFSIAGHRVDFPWLIPLGWYPANFVSSDYFPLLPNFGFFLIGAFLGKTVYQKKKTILPMVRDTFPPIAFLRWCGKQSLWIYLLHQPILSGLFYLYDLLV